MFIWYREGIVISQKWNACDLKKTFILDLVGYSQIRRVWSFSIMLSVIVKAVIAHVWSGAWEWPDAIPHVDEYHDD